MTARLEIENLRKSAGDTTLLDGASVYVEAGEIVVVYGRSGCGKTALLDAVSGRIDPDSGDIRIDGKSIVGAPPESRGIGMAFQNFALYPHWSAFDNIASPLIKRGLPRGEIERKTRAIAELLKIDAALSHFPHALSNGQKQRASLARALVGEPSVLLLDDPLRNVDAKLRYETRLEMPDLFRRFDAAVVYVTQDCREAMALASRVAVMRDGRFVQTDAPETVYDFPASADIARVFGEPTINLLPCETVAVDGGLSVFPAGCRVDLGGRADLPPGLACLAGARPEDVLLFRDPATAPAGATPAVARTSTAINIFSSLSLETESGEQIVASCPEEDAFQFARGSAAKIAFAADKIRLFAREDGRLLL